MPKTLSKSNAEIKNSLLLTSLFQKRKKKSKKILFQVQREKNLEKTRDEKGLVEEALHRFPIRG